MTPLRDDATPDLDRQLRAALETISLLGVVLDTRGRVVFANDFTLRLLGWTRSELVGRDWFEAALPADVAGAVKGIFQSAIGTGEIPAHFDNEVQPKTGGRRIVAWSNTVLRNAQGHVDGVASIGEDVTEQRDAVEQLRNVIASVDAIVGYRPSADAPLRMSPQIAAMLGHDPADITSYDAWIRLVHPDDIARCREVWDSEPPRDVWYLEYRVQRADGTWLWVDDRGRRTPAVGGNGDGIYGLVADASVRREAAERLRANEARLEAVFEENPEAIGICSPEFDADGHFTDARLVAANRVTRNRYLGGKRPEDLNAPLLFATWPALAPLRAAATAVSERHTAVRIEQHATEGGQDIWSDVLLFPFADGFAFIGRDITEQRRAETQAHAANARMRRLFDAGIVGMALKRRGGRVLEANDYWLDLAGRTREELERGEINSPMPTEDDEPGHPQETAYVQPDGTTVPVLIIRTTDPDEPDLVTVLVLDMRHERDARADHARLATAIDQTSESVVITDLDANILFVNPAFERISGYTLSEARGKNPRLLKSGVQGKHFYEHLWATLQAGATWHGEFVNRRKDGTLYAEEASISPIRDAGGVITSYVAVKRDVTAERETEAQLRQAQRVEAIGQLAGGVAHDFNNYLAAIRGYGELVQGSLADGSQAQADMEQVMLATVRASDLTRQLLAFSRGSPLKADVLDPAAVIDALVPMLRSLIGEQITLVSVRQPDLGVVYADAGRLEQAIVNLAVNARDAMPDGGRLTFDCRNVEPTGIEPAWVRISVSDTGSGIPPDVLARIFDPFFTTKDPDKGTGQGLATVYGIVRQAGGRIAATSVPGAGSTFTIDLPRVDERAASIGHPSEPAATTPEEDHETVPTGKRVLLVEDDKAVRVLLKRLLARHGHDVVAAADGAEALEQAKRGPALDLLVTDVRMPGMQGPELARLLRVNQPNLPVLLISGYANEIAGDVLAMPRVGVLDKPFDAETFGAAVRAALDDGQGR